MLLRFFILATISLSCACSLPGLRMDDYPVQGGDTNQAASARYYDGAAVNANAQMPTPVITPISASLIKQQRQGNKAPRSSFDFVRNDPAFQAPYIYRIGIGDNLLIKVWGHPELVAEGRTEGETIGAGQIVQPDGTVYVPSVGPVLLAGMTFSEARSAITDALAVTIKNPQVDIQALSYLSQFAYIVGDVERPCRLTLTHVPVTMLDGLNQCEAIKPTIGRRSITLTRRGQQYSVDLNTLYESTNPEPFYLRHGDKLIVSDDKDQRIFLVGEFEEQLSVGIPVSGLSLADAMAAAGGINLTTANAAKIYVIRGIETAQNTDEIRSLAPDIFHLDASSVDAFILADHFKLRPRDVVYAGSADLADWNRALDTMEPTLRTLFQLRILTERN